MGVVGFRPLEQLEQQFNLAEYTKPVEPEPVPGETVAVETVAAETQAAPTREA
jgi:hypothetical protein